jgi:hypothetical protein
MPVATVIGHAATGDEAMHMRMGVQVCNTAITPTVPPTWRRSRASSMTASAVAFMSAA